MTDDAEALFGGRSARPSFTDRVTRGQFLPPREKSPPAAATPLESNEPTAIADGYKPYGFMPANTVGEVCEVRSWMAGTTIPEGIVFQYRFLMQVGYVGDELLKLMLPDCIVVIEGRHLSDLRQKLSRRMVTFIQEYNLRLWQRPPDAEAVILRIETLKP